METAGLEPSSYAMITQHLVASAMAEGLTREEDLLDLSGARQVKISGEDLYYKEYEEFQQQTRESAIAPPTATQAEQQFNAFWRFMQEVRSGIYTRFRPALQRDQAFNFLPVDKDFATEKEVRSTWLQEVFEVIVKYLPTYSGSPSDYAKLSDTPEAMFQLSFIDAAYQRLSDRSLDQMQFTLPEAAPASRATAVAGPAARPYFVSQATKPVSAPAEVTISENPEVELIATLSR